ncbi:MAG: site-specific DNA-methyltransferase [Bacteroidales bacterium]|nr:site-specific DNA-methyltransferase [Bacteroidales bacterium]
MAKKDYTNWDRKDLIKEIEQLRKRKKYGLVWENKPENVVEQCKTELPVLEEVKTKEIITDPDKPINLLIEGDNYHALSVLNYTHKGKIDVIYIDPPYNTGAKDWKYNNDYVDENDQWRHSKWIQMMEHRLNHARKLLSQTGFIICAIDKYELFSLGLLMDEIFGEKNRLGVISVVHKPEGRNQEKFFGTSNEFMFVYAKSINSASFNKITLDDELADRFSEEDEQGSYRLKNFIRLTDGKYSLRKNKPHFFYPIYVSQNLENFSLEEKKGYIATYPITDKGVERTWKTTKETFLKLATLGNIVAKKESDKIVLYEKLREDQVIKTHWIKKEYHGYHFGTKLIEEILGAKKFDFPKSLYLVFDILKLVSKKDSIILDFFAGSGTTGHAVLELNKNDGGNRKFILCTNNENDIAEEVCYPRIEKVINGYKFWGQDKSILFEQKLSKKLLANIDIVLDDLKKAREHNKPNYDKLEVKIEDNTLRLYGLKKSNGKKEGLGGNLKYFKTSFVPADPTDKNKIALTEKATEMLCVKEDTFEAVKTTKQYKIFRNKKRYTGIVFDHQAIDDFKKEIAKIDGKFSLYIFSLGDDTFDEEFEDMKKKVKLSPIPEAILRVYRRIFK